MRKRFMIALPAIALAATTLTACGGADDSGEGASEDQLNVTAAFYPLAFAAEQIGGDNVYVTDLTPVGIEPHDQQMDTETAAAVVDSDAVIYLGEFMPELDALVDEYAADKALEVGESVSLLSYDEEIAEDGHSEEEHAEEEHVEEGEAHTEEEHTEEEHTEEEHSEEEEAHDHGSSDPHFWLDPIRYAELGTALADYFSELDPDNAETYAANAETFTTELTALDDQYTETLGATENRDLVVAHAAFGYTADSYGLNQIAVSGLSPDEEPSPERMAEITDYVNDHGVSTIFFETIASPDVAETIANETGAQVAVLDPIEGLTADTKNEDYFSIMESNLAALEQALAS